MIQQAPSPIAIRLIMRRETSKYFIMRFFTDRVLYIPGAPAIGRKPIWKREENAT
jgi:hypothetical protein